MMQKIMFIETIMIEFLSYIDLIIVVIIVLLMVFRLCFEEIVNDRKIDLHENIQI